MTSTWDREADASVRSGFDTCDRVLALVGDRGEALVTRGQGRSALTRFANSRIHQNMDGDDDHVRLQVVVDGGRSASATTTRVDDDGLARLVDGAIAAARLLPVDTDFPGLAGPSTFASFDHFDNETAEATPDARAEVVADFVATGAGLESAGYCSTTSSVHVLRSTSGLRCASRTSMAQIDAIHRAAASSGPPTGSSIGSESFGGYPGDLFLGGGDSAPRAMIADVDRGLLVTDLWYNRILDPKTQVVTGLTRNGLFLIEDGEVVAPVQNLRFTQSVVAGMAPGHVLAVGDDAQLVSNEGGIVHVPSLRLASWAFTGNAQG